VLRCTVAHAPPYIPHSCVGMSRNDVECWHAALRGWSRGVMGGGLSISSTHAFNLIDGLSRRRARTAHAHAPTDGGARHLRDDGPARRARRAKHAAHRTAAPLYYGLYNFTYVPSPATAATAASAADPRPDASETCFTPTRRHHHSGADIRLQTGRV
jgi:hypothetical protein